MTRELPPLELADELERRYSAYLRSSFYFKDPNLRASFRKALNSYGLKKGPFLEPDAEFQRGARDRDLAYELLPDAGNLIPALMDKELWSHQEAAIRRVRDGRNIVVATGTASGKTESFLYPILFHLYHEHLEGTLGPGVRALILYPMNALAHDQRKRLGNISSTLKQAGSNFEFTFGQYIGDTPPTGGEAQAYPGELSSRKRMQKEPPHILLTNYSMLEYLLIRPGDSPLFDLGEHWRFIVLDEAHQYRGAKGIEMSMLLRRLKCRLREGKNPRTSKFTCIATSATVASGENEQDQHAVANFATDLFGESFTQDDVIFGKKHKQNCTRPRRYHIFLRALEGAFITYNKNENGGKEEIIINREKLDSGGRSIEIALCRECGQHYFVGREKGGILEEAIRDPSHDDFGVEFYRPIGEYERNRSQLALCRTCGQIGSSLSCECIPSGKILIEKCQSHDEYGDRLKSCPSCGYRGVDPVHEIVHGSDGPNAVISTVIHQSLPPERQKILAFADSRQEAAFFAWYAQSSYESIRDRNLIFHSLRSIDSGNDFLSLEDLADKLLQVCEHRKMFPETHTNMQKIRQVWRMIYREMLSDQPRISLEGVGLVRWFPQLPRKLETPQELLTSPWNLNEDRGRDLFIVMLNYLRSDRVVELLNNSNTRWEELDLHPQQWVYTGAKPARMQNLVSWEGRAGRLESRRVKFLARLLGTSNDKEAANLAQDALISMWAAIDNHDNHARPEDRIFVTGNGQAFHLNLRWWRATTTVKDSELFQCDTCARLQSLNVGNLCLRSGCPGKIESVSSADLRSLRGDHYRRLYEDKDLPAIMESAEHTAQLTSQEALERQKEFSKGHIHVLSSSTTFEVGVDLGDLDIAFMRNVPPEAFNYTQRAGRAGRRGTPGVAVTYCRRNPHDLYHFAEPEKRILKGEVRPPVLNLKNPKIIERHMTAVALSHFFRKHSQRYTPVASLFGGDIGQPSAVSDFRSHCQHYANEIRQSLLEIIPDDAKMMKTKLLDDSWIDHIAGENSRFALTEDETKSDYLAMQKAANDFYHMQQGIKGDRAKRRAESIGKEDGISFLSRKAIIPKYGFPVDVVELDTGRASTESGKVELQRDLALAISEFAPGCKLVANKLEWSSAGIKRVDGREWEVRSYRRCLNCNSFEHWLEDKPTPPLTCCDNPNIGQRSRKYLIPRFGFVSPMQEKAREPKGRTYRLYTTRPFFAQLEREVDPKLSAFGVGLTKSCPGEMVVLCEGKNGREFYICQVCGRGFSSNEGEHITPYGMKCTAKPTRLSLGHRFITDVVRANFPRIDGNFGGSDQSFSLACALVEGAAKVLGIPSTDINAVLDRCSDRQTIYPIVLYDNVPGGAGLVARLDEPGVLAEILHAAKERVNGKCGCHDSCYGCLRSYRNQFAHPNLCRVPVFEYLDELIKQESNAE